MIVRIDLDVLLMAVQVWAKRGQGVVKKAEAQASRLPVELYLS